MYAILVAMVMVLPVAYACEGSVGGLGVFDEMSWRGFRGNATYKRTQI